MTHTITIESGIKCPPRTQQTEGISRTLRTLKVGQSFRLPDKSSKFTVYSSAVRIGIKITTRKVNEKDWNGTRVWRTK